MFIPLSVLEFRDRAATYFGDKIGVIDGDTELTYRAWANGDAVAVAMRTVWDSAADAQAFADAARSWIDEGDTPGFVTRGAKRTVQLGWATDGATLQRLQESLAQ